MIDDYNPFRQYGSASGGPNITKRKNVCRLLNRLPNWLFPQTERVFIHPQLLASSSSSTTSRRNSDNISKKRKQSVMLYHEDEDETSSGMNDSALDISGLSSSTVNENLSLVEMPQKQQITKPSRRLSYCCPETKNQFTGLHDELRLLREEIALLVNLKDITKSNQPDEHCPNNEPISKITFPDTTTLHSNYSEENDNLQEQDGETEEKRRRSDMKEVLKGLGTVSLKPINGGTPVRKRQNDVRNDLQEILKRRYSAMHSPVALRRSLTLLEDSDENDMMSPVKYSNKRLTMY